MPPVSHKESKEEATSILTQGEHVRKYNGKLIIKPAKKAVKGLLAKVGGILKRNVSTKPAEVIRQLNSVIRGWANYHRHVCSKKTFSHVDAQIWRKLWRC